MVQRFFGAIRVMKAQAKNSEISEEPIYFTGCCGKNILLHTPAYTPSHMSANHLPHDDQMYLEALIRHDQSLIETIYREHAARIRAMVISNGGDASDAGDVFQDALTDIYRQAQRGYLLTCSFKSFFYAVCRNKWLDELRKRGRSGVTMQAAEQLVEEDAAVAADELYRHEERLELLAHTLKRLGPSCRDIFNLAWSVNPESGKYYSLIEVAERLNLSYAYLRKKKSECEKTLREKIKMSPDFIKLKGE